MYIKYEVPEHLERYLSNLPEEKVRDILTLMLELAINKGLINYPLSYVEMNMKSIREDVVQLTRETKLHNSSIDTLLDVQSKKVESLIVDMKNSLTEQIKSVLNNLEDKILLNQSMITSSGYVPQDAPPVAEFTLTEEGEDSSKSEEDIQYLLDKMLEDSLMGIGG